MYCYKPRRPYLQENCYLMRVNGLPFPPGMLRSNVLRGNELLFPPGIFRGTLLRGNLPIFPRGLLRGNVLRWNGVSFSAQNGKL